MNNKANEFDELDEMSTILKHTIQKTGTRFCNRKYE